MLMEELKFWMKRLKNNNNSVTKLIYGLNILLVTLQKGYFISYDKHKWDVYGKLIVDV